MDSRDRHHRVQQLVEAARSLEPDTRQKYLLSACDGDQELISEVVTLISANRIADSLLSTVTPTLSTNNPFTEPGIEGTEATRLTAEPTPDWCPIWSPDGKQLLYYSYRTGNRELWLLPATGGAATQLTNSKGLDAAGSWSPDGLKISFRSERSLSLR